MLQHDSGEAMTIYRINLHVLVLGRSHMDGEAHSGEWSPKLDRLKDYILGGAFCSGYGIYSGIYCLWTG